MAIVIGYGRVSTDEQAESGLGLDAQRRDCSQWCVRNGYSLDGWEKDEGLSGSLSLEERPGLVAAIARIGKGDILLVAKRDRLSRADPVATAMIEGAVMRQGGRVISAAGEGTGDDSPSSIFTRRLTDAFGEYERLVIAARTKAALSVKKSRNEVTGRVPYGKRIDASSSARSRKSGLPAGLVDDELEATALECIKRWRAEGVSFREIARRLDDEGIPTKGGMPWRQSTVYSLIKRLERDEETASAG